MAKLFNTKEEVEHFLLRHMPIAIRSKKQAKTHFVSAFTSDYAGVTVLAELTDALWQKVNESSS